MENVDQTIIEKSEQVFWSKKRDGQRVSCVLAVGEAYKKVGEEDIRILLEQKGQLLEIKPPSYFLGFVGEKNIPKYIDALARVINGTVIPYIDMTPGEGWETRTVLDDINSSISTLPFTRIELEPIEKALKSSGLKLVNDDRQTQVITEKLFSGQKLDYFFQNPQTILALSLLDGITRDWGNVNYGTRVVNFLGHSILETGRAFNGYVQILRESTENSN